MPFKYAGEYVRELELRNIQEWCEYCQSGKKPIDTPAKPNRTSSMSGRNGYSAWLCTVSNKPKI